VTFFAEERVDVRELAGKLGERLGRRVDFKQVSARDESRIVGGYGPCGRSLCCATFAGDQDPVSIRMAKDQSLPLNPSKISGCCGRLMCCLKYEHGVYLSFRKRAPKRGAIVVTPGGEGKVVELLAPADSVVVDHGEGRSATYRLADLGRGAESKE
jgi:cell fate regulator YaaT (PSP1 superfamily)